MHQRRAFVILGLKMADVTPDEGKRLPASVPTKISLFLPKLNTLFLLVEKFKLVFHFTLLPVMFTVETENSNPLLETSPVFNRILLNPVV